MTRIVQSILALSIALSLTLIGCGGGGGGGGKEPLQPALVTLYADPLAIKIGDRTLVTVEMQNIDPNGVFMKLRYSHSLSFIEGTAELTVSADSVEVNPVEGPIEKTNYVYMTFYIPAESFGDENYGRFTMQLRGMEIADEAEVQIDVDLHDPEKDPSEEFDSDEPLFGIDDNVEIEISRK